MGRVVATLHGEYDVGERGVFQKGPQLSVSETIFSKNEGMHPASQGWDRVT